MRIAALIAYGLICIPGFMVGMPLFVHLLLWPFEISAWYIKLMMFFADLSILMAVLTHYKKEWKYRGLIAWMALVILCIPIVYVYFYTGSKILSSPFFVLPSIAFVVMYIWSLVGPSAQAGKVFQKDCCKEA